MKATLFCYTLGKLDPAKRTEFKRELFGYKDYSNRGKYRYKRKGLLDKIQHIKPIRSVIIIMKKDEKKLNELLDKYDAHYSTYLVELTKKDLEN